MTPIDSPEMPLASEPDEDQHATAPVESNAHDSFLPAEIAVTELDNPEMSRNVEPLLPQHFTPPVESSAHVPDVSAEMAVTSDSPLTSVGVDLVVVVPSPICREEFSPQHFTPPVESSAHVC